MKPKKINETTKAICIEFDVRVGTHFFYTSKQIIRASAWIPKSVIYLNKDKYLVKSWVYPNIKRNLIKNANDRLIFSGVKLLDKNKLTEQQKDELFENDYYNLEKDTIEVYGLDVQSSTPISRNHMCDDDDGGFYGSIDACDGAYH